MSGTAPGVPKTDVSNLVRPWILLDAFDRAAFVDNGIEVEMAVEPLPGGVLVIRGERMRVRGLPLPRFGILVEFRSRVEDRHHLVIGGALLMRPKSRFWRFVARSVLRRPDELGAIHYRIGPAPG